MLFESPDREDLLKLVPGSSSQTNVQSLHQEVYHKPTPKAGTRMFSTNQRPKLVPGSSAQTNVQSWYQEVYSKPTYKAGTRKYVINKP